MVGIKDMEMPKSCALCERFEGACKYTDFGDYQTERNPSCPLVEIVTCKDCISRANALRVAKNEYLRGWHNALCKALSEKYSIHCKEGNFSVIQEETITGLGLSMDCAVGKDAESYMSALPSVTPTRKKGKWVLHTYMPHKNYCSECEKDSPYNKRWGFCPNCGAEMESEDA